MNISIEKNVSPLYVALVFMKGKYVLYTGKSEKDLSAEIEVGTCDEFRIVSRPSSPLTECVLKILNEIALPKLRRGETTEEDVKNFIS